MANNIFKRAKKRNHELEDRCVEWFKMSWFLEYSVSLTCIRIPEREGGKEWLKKIFEGMLALNFQELIKVINPQKYKSQGKIVKSTREMKQITEIPRFIVFCFIALHLYCIFFTNWRCEVTPHGASCHFSNSICSRCVCVTFW